MTRPKKLGGAEKSVRKKRLAFCALYALSGAIFALPLLFGKLWFIAWFAVCPVIYAEMHASFSDSHPYLKAWGRGMCFFLFYGFVTYYWFWELYPLDFLNYGKAEALAVVLCAFIGLPAVQGAVSSFFFVFITAARRGGIIQRHPVLFSFFASSLWCVGEWIQTRTWAGVPWGRLAVGQVSYPPAVQSASLFGSYFVSFLIILANAFLAGAVPNAKSGATRRRRGIMAILFLVTVLSNFIFGNVRISLNNADGKSVSVAAVQGNIPYEDKWSQTQYSLNVYKTLTEQAAEGGAELVLWPETALPCDITQNSEAKDAVEKLSRECGSDILYGAFQTDSGKKLYNAVLYASPDGDGESTSYRKRRLVPFGEYIPGEDLVNAVFPFLAGLVDLENPMYSGDSPEIFDINCKKVGCLICFDSVYEENCLESVRSGAQLICVSTNDSWFGSSAALRQHNAHAALRAVENGRYVVRSANTGISSIISPYGEICESLGEGERGFIAGEVKMLSSTTLYTRIGNIPLLLCALFCTAIAAAAGVNIYRAKKMRHRETTGKDKP